MTRSRKKLPICGMTMARGEKQDKLVANRRLRRRINELELALEEVLPLLREVSDVWAFAKDGKQWVKDKAEQKKVKRK